MTWLNGIAAVVRAIPEIANSLRLINESLIKLGDIRTEIKINKLEQELNTAITRIKDAKTDAELLDLAKRINNLRL